MSRTVSIDEMADAINEGLKEYATLASTQVKSAVRKSAKTVKDQISSNAPSRTGAYKGSWVATKQSESSQSLQMVVHKNAKWDKRRSYRMIGNPFLEQRLVSFQIQEALPIENGKVLDGTVSPTFALCRAEGSPSQNNPTPEEKADSGAL